MWKSAESRGTATQSRERGLARTTRLFPQLIGRTGRSASSRDRRDGATVRRCAPPRSACAAAAPQPSRRLTPLSCRRSDRPTIRAALLPGVRHQPRGARSSVRQCAVAADVRGPADHGRTADHDETHGAAPRPRRRRARVAPHAPCPPRACARSQNLPFQTVQHQVVKCDPQPTTSGGIIIMVTGNLVVRAARPPHCTRAARAARTRGADADGTGPALRGDRRWTAAPIRSSLRRCGAWRARMRELACEPSPRTREKPTAACCAPCSRARGSLSSLGACAPPTQTFHLVKFDGQNWKVANDLFRLNVG
jgi:hypothetical protein